MRGKIVILALSGLSIPALAADEVAYGDVPEWVRPALETVEPAQRQGAFAVLARDVQVRLDNRGQHAYELSDYLVQTAEGLALGNLTVVWNPAAGGPTVHAVEIVRDGEVIDVLANQQFRVFQREGGLEESFLDGLLTASLQVPGLRVGDRLRFALTSTSRDPTLPDNPYGILGMPGIPSDGSYRVSLEWDRGHEPNWRATDDIAEAAVVADNSIAVQLDQPGQHFMPEGAPLRYLPARLVEYSDFADWQQVSRSLFPLYRDRAEIPQGSELEGDVARIMRTNATETERARAALRLVQDQVRYVYVGMNGGNLTPATVAETWDRRYGDCKGKTVLLLALLGAMGIEAEPVVVNQTTGGDGIDRFLPSPAQFDHVLVRATVDGRKVWMDGTRQGDTRLDTAPPDAMRQVLPLSAAGADLEVLPFVPPAQPQRIRLVHVDASDGIDRLTTTTVTTIYRGIEALQMRAALQSFAPDQLDQVLRRLAGGEGSWEELQDLGWSYDEDRAAVILNTTGIARLEWDEADDEAITSFPIAHGGFYPPAQRRRPPQQDQTLPYRNDPLYFTCDAVTIRLPRIPQTQGWDHGADAMNVVIGGQAFWRMGDIVDGEMRMVRSNRTLVEEISAEEARAANAAIPGFDNSQSWVQLRRYPVTQNQRKIAAGGITRVPATHEVDWLTDASACLAPPA